MVNRMIRITAFIAFTLSLLLRCGSAKLAPRFHLQTTWTIGAGQLRWSPDGTLLALDTWETIDLRDVPGGTLQHQVPFRVDRVRYTDLAWQPNTHVLSIGYQTSVFYQINADTGKTQSIPTNHTVSMWGVSYAADGRWLATSSNDSIVEIWTTQTMSRTMQLRGFGGVFHPIDPDLFAVAELRSPHIRLWSVPGQEPTVTLTGTESMMNMVFSPNGQYLAAQDIYRAYVWDLTTMERVLIADESIDRLIFSPQSDRIAILNNRESRITVVESATGDTVETFTRDLDPPVGITTMAFSPDGTMLLAGGGANGTDFEPGPPQDLDRRVWVWDIASGDLVQYLEHPTTVSAIAFSPDGTRLATASGTTVQLWTISSSP